MTIQKIPIKSSETEANSNKAMPEILKYTDQDEIPEDMVCTFMYIG